VTNNDLKMDQNTRDFVLKDSPTKLGIAVAAGILAKHARRHRWNYDQLSRVFRIVRERCEIEVPRPNKNELLELPTEEELTKFYAVIENPIHTLMFKVLEGTGLRVAELTHLEVARIDFQLNQAFVSEGKGKKDRIIVLGTKLVEKLRIYLSGRKNKYLFESERLNTKYSTRRIEQLCKEYKETAAIMKDLTPHTFRHLYNTRLAQAGMSEEKRALLAGHSDPATQKIYTHLSLAGIKDEAIAVMDGLDK